MISVIKSLGLALASAAAAMALVLLGLALMGYSPWVVGANWLKGSTGLGLGDAARIAISFKEACPLLLTGLAAAVAFRSGVLNIGAQGQFVMGALAATALATRFIPPGPSWFVIILALAGGTAAGALWAGIAAALERTRGVPVVLSTILLNFVAAYLATALLLGPLQNPHADSPTSASVSPLHYLPAISESLADADSPLAALGDLHIGVPIAFIIAFATWILLRQTTFGFELLVAGLNPRAATLAGIPVATRQAGILLFSGGFAGLAGAIQILGVTHGMSDNTSDYGYAGIAVALLGRLHPLGTAAAAVFFGMLDTGARYVEKQPALGVPHDIQDVAKGVIILGMLVGTAWAARRRLKAGK